MNPKIIGAIIGVIIVGGASFWGGMTYAQSKQPAGRGQFFTAGAGGPGGARGGANRFGGGGGAFGSIIAKDATSITIQLMGGPNASSTGQTGSGTKIVLYDTSTQVGKFTTGTAKDLVVGDNVTVAGSPNSDGSITAQMIQIRPAGTQFGGGRGAQQ